MKSITFSAVLILGVTLLLVGSEGFKNSKINTNPHNLKSTGANGGESIKAPAYAYIKNGTLLGETETAINGRTLYTFKKIPYAQPPVGDFRFRPPQYPLAWGSEIRDATQFPPSCPQANSIVASDEDCLYLNVYTTKAENEQVAPLPVLVYFHGGGFVAGESASSSGRKLLNHEGVLVVVQYRLGTLGFLSTGDEASPGNNGLKDMVQSLRWVQENIERFGGDPDQVTIAGSSAGSASVLYLLLSPLTPGLFNKVIAMSGTPLYEGSLDRNPWKSAQTMALWTGCPIDSTSSFVACMRDQPWQLVVAAANALEAQATAQLSFTTPTMLPVIEPNLPGAFITEDPLSILVNGTIPDVAIILGVTLHEGSFKLGLLYRANFRPNNLINDPVWLRDQLISSLLRAYGVEESASGSISTSLAKIYMPNKSRQNWLEIMPNLIDLVSVLFVKAPIARIADLLSKRNLNVYLYSLEHYSENSMWPVFFPDIDTEIITPGITHADDSMYIFDTPNFNPSAEDTQFSLIYNELLMNFVTHGNPTPSASGLYPVWPKYTIDEQRYLTLTHQPTVSEHFPSSWRPSLA